VDKDCRRMELWRNPLSWGPKGQVRDASISQAKGQSADTILSRTGEWCVLLMTDEAPALSVIFVIVMRGEINCVRLFKRCQ